MRTGPLTPLGSIKGDTWERIYDYTVGNGNLLVNGSFEGWVGGTSVAPDGWTSAGLGSSIAREATTVKLGTYSAKFTRSGADCYFQEEITQKLGGLAQAKGKTITAGVWVWASVASRARFQIYDGGSVSDRTYSSYHTGNSTWQYLTITRTISSDANSVWISMLLDSGDTTAYFDGAYACEGAFPTGFDNTSLLNFEQNSLSISGLNGDSDEEYILESKVVNGYNGASYVGMYLNNDTGSNYGYQDISGINTTAAAYRGAIANFSLSDHAALADVSVSQTRIFAKSGKVRTMLNELLSKISTTTVTGVYKVGGSWNNTADNLTSIVLGGSQVGVIGVGSSFQLYRKTRRS